MLCYRDRTFCSFYLDCRNANVNGGACTRPLTPEVSEAAKKWGNKIIVDGERWEAPIAQFLRKPHCWRPILDDEDPRPICPYYVRGKRCTTPNCGCKRFDAKMGPIGSTSEDKTSSADAGSSPPAPPAKRHAAIDWSGGTE